jgi:hypothetical protein
MQAESNIDLCVCAPIVCVCVCVCVIIKEVSYNAMKIDFFLFYCCAG